MARLKWRLIRLTRAGRRVSTAALSRWGSAKSGVAAYFVRNRVSVKIRSFHPRRFSYTIFADFRFQFPKRATIRGTLDRVLDPRTFRKRFRPDSFVGTSAFRSDLNFGTWEVYRDIVRDLLLKNRAQLPGYARRVGKKEGFRRYRRFDLRIRAERITRPMNGRRKKRKRHGKR